MIDNLIKENLSIKRKIVNNEAEEDGKGLAY